MMEIIIYTVRLMSLLWVGLLIVAIFQKFRGEKGIPKAGWSALFIFIASIFIFFLGFSQYNRYSHYYRIEEKSPVQYRILKEYCPTGAKIINMTILISPEVTETDIYALAKYLRNKNEDYTFISIGIYDLEEAYLRISDSSYPEKEIDRHWVAQIWRNTTTNIDTIEIRDRKTNKLKMIYKK